MAPRVTLVIGSTGRIGSAVVGELAGRTPVRAFVRDRARGERRLSGLGGDVELVGGDLAEPETIREAMRGVGRVFLVCGHDRRQADLEINAIDAAAASGVDHLVKLSGGSAGVGPDSSSPIGRAHWQAERRLAASGVGFTILRPAAFMQNLLEMAPLVARTGLVAAPMGRARVAMVDIRDIAAVAATVIEGEPQGAVLEVTGPRALGFEEIAASLTAATEQRIVYANVPLAVARRALERRGPPGWLLEHQLAAIEIGRSGAAASVSATVERVTGEPARDFDRFAAEHAASFRRPGGALAPAYAATRALSTFAVGSISALARRGNGDPGDAP